MKRPPLLALGLAGAAGLLLFGGPAVTTGFSSDARLQATVSAGSRPVPPPACATGTVSLTHRGEGPATPFACTNPGGSDEEAFLTFTAVTPGGADLQGIELKLGGDVRHMAVPLAVTTYDIGPVPAGRTIHGSAQLKADEGAASPGLTASFTVTLEPAGSRSGRH